MRPAHRWEFVLAVLLVCQIRGAPVYVDADGVQNRAGKGGAAECAAGINGQCPGGNNRQLLWPKMEENVRESRNRLTSSSTWHPSSNVVAPFWEI